MNAITAPQGFVAAGIHAGLKASGKLDLSLLATTDGRPVAAAGVFTSNKLTAAPVHVSRAPGEEGDEPTGAPLCPDDALCANFPDNGPNRATSCGE